MGNKVVKFGNRIADVISRSPRLTIAVKTGDLSWSGTDNKVYIRLYDVEGKTSEAFLLNNTWSNDFEKGQTDLFHFPITDLGDIVKIEIWKEGLLDNKWFVEKIEVSKLGMSFIFPVHRWIPRIGKHLFLCQYDSVLPQDDSNTEQRADELRVKRGQYPLTTLVPGCPKLTAGIPLNEDFTFNYLFDFGKLFSESVLRGVAAKILNFGTIKKIDDFKKLYDGKNFPVPNAANDPWESDDYFGWQRVTNCNCVNLQLCKQIPENFPVTDEILSAHLENMNLREALEGARLFIINHAILDGATTRSEDFKICSPICLLYRTEKGALLPVAIQLYQTPAEDNPIFYPEDGAAWDLAKLWFNNADANLHEAIQHLGLTHLMMESVWVSANRQMSPSHPVFRLIAPHFLYNIAINDIGLKLLVGEGAWFDTITQLGDPGLKEILGKILQNYKLEDFANLPKDIELRGVAVETGLVYPYRDCALILFQVFEKYVKRIVQHIYVDSDKLKNDRELQMWREELVAENGCNIQGIPGDEVFATVDDVVAMVTSIIFHCSVGHAIRNFSMYDDYAFPPNYPLLLHGDPPRDKNQREADFLRALPTCRETIDIMWRILVLSTRTTQPLGRFEVQYAYDPVSVQALKELREDLVEAEVKMKIINTKLARPFTVLYPSRVPNSITI